MTAQDELNALQAKLLEAIKEHQLILIKWKKDPENATVDEQLREVQQRIMQLSGKQKEIMNDLRFKNRVEHETDSNSRHEQDENENEMKVNDCDDQNESEGVEKNGHCEQNFGKFSDRNQHDDHNSGISGSSSQRNQHLICTELRPTLAMKTMSGQTKILVPVTTGPKRHHQILQQQNQHLLVVPAPGGYAAGTRGLPSSLLKPLKLPAQLSNKNPTSLLAFAKINSTVVKSSDDTSLNDQILTKPHQHQLAVGTNNSQTTVVTTSATSNHNNSVSSSQRMTVHHIRHNCKPAGIDLSTEKKFKEYFMSGLGLVTKEALSEIQNRKYERKRRTTANPRFSNAAIEAKKATALALAAKKARRRLLIEHKKEIDDGYMSMPNTRSLSSFIKPNQRHSRHQTPPQTPPLSPGSQRPSSPAALMSFVTSKNLLSSINGLNVSQNCFVCEESCDPDLDAIMFCKPCRCLFHATCASTVDDIGATKLVPCPKCEERRPIEDETNCPSFDLVEQKQYKLSSFNGKFAGLSDSSRKRFELKQRLLKRRKDLDTKNNDCKQNFSKLKLVLEAQQKEWTRIDGKRNAVQTSIDQLIDVIKLIKESETSPEKRMKLERDREMTNDEEKPVVEEVSVQDHGTKAPSTVDDETTAAVNSISEDEGKPGDSMIHEESGEAFDLEDGLMIIDTENTKSNNCTNDNIVRVVQDVKCM